jgi:hypothetical protein
MKVKFCSQQGVGIHRREVDFIQPILKVGDAIASRSSGREFRECGMAKYIGSATAKQDVRTAIADQRVGISGTRVLMLAIAVNPVAVTAARLTETTLPKALPL